MEGEKKYVYK